MEKVHLRLSEPQAKRLLKGGVVQLTPDALKDNAHWLILEKKTATKVRRAQRAGKGCRICLSPQEVEHSGAGIKEFFQKAVQGVKQGAKWLKQNIIDTPEYQQYVKPLVRQVVDKGMSAAAAKLGSAAPAANMAVNRFGEMSGAYGLREDLAKVKGLYDKHAKKYVAPHLRRAAQSAEQALVRRAKKMAPQFASDIDKLHEEYGEKAITAFGNRTGAYGLSKTGLPIMRKGRGLQRDYSNFLNPSHPAMRPVYGHLPAMGTWMYVMPAMDKPYAKPANWKLVSSGDAGLRQEEVNVPQLPTKIGGSFKVAGKGYSKRGGSFMPA